MKDNAKKWIGALRSGKYNKSKGQLHYVSNGKHYHCLFGVCCDLYQKDKGDLEEKTFQIDGDDKVYYSYDGRVGYMPEKVRQWVGLKDLLGTHTVKVSGINFASCLLRLNDSDPKPDNGPPEREYSFKELASLIEKARNLFED